MVWQQPPDIEIKWPVDFICIYKTGERRFLGGSKNAFEAFVGGEACLHTWLDESELRSAPPKGKLSASAPLWENRTR